MKENIEQLACEYIIARLTRRKSKEQIRSWFRKMWSQDESYPCEYGDGCWKDRDLLQSNWCGLCNEHHALRNSHAQNMKKYRRALGRLERATTKVIKPMKNNSPVQGSVSDQIRSVNNES